MELSTDGGKRETTYRYNALNQLVKKADIEGEETYTYDKRGNLSQIIRSGQVRNEYLYGVLNRLEEARNHKGEIARYAYNGLGHRIGKQTGQAEIPQVQTESNLDPVRRLNEQSFVPTGQINYTLDLTKQYHNLLQSREEGAERNQTQTYLWDGNAVGVYTDGNDRMGGTRIASTISQDYYFQDELGSPIRLMDESGTLREVYGYDEFGQNLYQNQENVQPFGYTGYQRDKIAETYYAQAREYKPQVGRFVSEDTHWNPDNTIYGDSLSRRIFSLPDTAAIKESNNLYCYVMNNPLLFIDLTGYRSKEASDQIIRDNADYIKNAAIEFGVDPAILAATIYTEQRLNVDWKDDYLDGIVGFYGVLDTSIGVSQVKVSTAKFIEEKGYMPSITGQYGGWNLPFLGTVHGTETMARTKALEDPLTNIRYAAAYLKYYQDIWESVYPDISSRPDILASLFNLGHIQTSPNSSPEPNGFGIFAGKNYDYMKELLGINSEFCPIE